MYTYYIAGVPKSPDFGHVVHVAENLKRSLPYWSHEVLAKTEEEYLEWQQQFCKERNWAGSKNPLVWKRVSNSNGPYHLIGGINEFFEMLKENYNLDTRLDRKIKMKMAKDNEKKMKFVLAARASAVQRVAPRGVCLTGAVYPSSCYLVSELLQLKQLHTEGGVSIYLHHSDPNKYGDLKKIKNELSEAEFNVRGRKALTVVNNIEECLSKCDLLIVMGDAQVKGDEKSETQRMNQNYNAMRSLASILNRHCPEFCKVMLMTMDMLCFNLSVLAEYAHKVYLYNIVGVTGHHGMKVLPNISAATGIPISDLHCPPVWGFVGTRKYVDWYHTVYHHKCGKSMARGEANDSENQIRHKYLMSKSGYNMDEEINGTDEHNPVGSEFHSSYSPEIRAAVTMISEWFHSENNKTISAAIFSDGTFGLPFGMFISQQVYLDNGEWKPDTDFSPPDQHVLKDIVSKVIEIVIEYDLGKRFHKYSKSPQLWWKNAIDSFGLSS